MLTDKELEILELLAKSWNMFCELEEQHPNDKQEFCKGIHDCQKMISLRIARHEYPKVFLNRKK